MIPSAMPNTLTVRTPTLEIAYEAHGREGGVPVVLLHGFPDDPRAFDAVAPPPASAGYRVLVPYLRGYGPTRLLDAAEPRMAQQAAIGQDLLDFMDALGIPARASPATTGAAAPPASPPSSLPSASARWSPSAVSNRRKPWLPRRPPPARGSQPSSNSCTYTPSNAPRASGRKRPGSPTSPGRTGCR